MSKNIAAEAERLEHVLGDPSHGDAALSFASSLASDEREEFPQSAVRALDAAGYSRQLVPTSCGGALSSFAQLLFAGRVVARRDLTTAIATGQTLLGALPVWLDGNEAQRELVAATVLAGGAGCLALTEEAHGSDIAATEVSLEYDASGERVLSGAKWCINNATRGAFMSVLAQTSSSAGTAHSIALVLKERLAAGRWENLPRLRTHGIRGADISGIRFDRAPLGADSVVGREGRGLDLALRTLQVSRTACAAFSLGAGDTALRMAYAFAASRRLYDGTAYSIPVVRASLAGALADLLAVEALCLVACRAASLVPAEMSLVSAVVKATAPSFVDDIVREAGVVLGARGYLREGPYGAFQKVARDHAVVGLFDGSTAVNLAVLAHQLPRLVEGRKDRVDDAHLGPGGLFDVAADCPAFDWNALRASARGSDSIVGSTPALARAIAGRGPSTLGALASRLAVEQASLDRLVLARLEEGGAPNGPEAFDLARRYCVIATATSCLGVWLASRDSTAFELDDAEWTAVVARVLSRLDHGEPSTSNLEPLSHRLETLAREQRMFSLFSIKLAHSP